jgi:sugar lactone lactonase YvrE
MKPFGLPGGCALLAITLACCSPASPSPTAAVTATATFAPPIFLKVQPTSTLSAAPSASRIPALTPPFIINPSLTVLAKDLPEPDDLLAAPNGVIYLSDVTAGTISQYTPGTGLKTVLSGLSAPEGMVLLPDGTLVIAEQGRNRLIRYDFLTRARSSFLVLQNKTGQEGLDGLGWDATTRTIIVPDSPNGTLWRVDAQGQVLGEITHGFARPTGAWAEADGSLLVVDENANSLSRIHPDGRVELLASLHTPDDVIEDSNGNIFVSTLGDGAIHVILAMTHQDVVLYQGFSDPQGVVFDSNGDLIVTDAGHHRLIQLTLH